MAVSSTTVVHRAGSRDTGDLQQVVADVVLSSSYTASGETITPASLGLTKVLGVTVIQRPANGRHPHWDGSKLRFYHTGAGLSGALAECAGATDVSGTYRLLVTGVV